jgi:hypothetical protein
MTKTSAQLDADIAEVLRAKAWQNYLITVPQLEFRTVDAQTWSAIRGEGLDEEHDAPKREQWVMAVLPISRTDAEGLRSLDPATIEKFNGFDIALKRAYGTRIIDLVDYDAGIVRLVTQLDREAHASKKIATPAEALRSSERAKALTDDAHSVLDHKAAADAHGRAAKLHKSDPAGKGVAWLHDLAESNHRQAAKARAAEGKIDAVKATQTRKGFAAYQEKLAAAREHGIMAEEYARQALAAARKRSE